jgi:flavodoxin
MRVLVTYFTQSGNTEQIAKAICDEASKGHEAQSKKVDEVKPDNCNDYDLVFIGTPVHAMGVAAPINELLGSLPQSPKFKLAGFATHCSPGFDTAAFEKALQSFEDTAKDKGIQFCGNFECQGKLDPALHPMVKQVQNMSDEEFQAFIDEGDKHPSAEDEQKAKEFARDVLSKI